MTQIIFRKYVESNEIIALFPSGNPIPYNGECCSYMHVGQHSLANYIGVINDTIPATKEEYTPLYNELVELGYDDLIVITHSEEKYCKYADVKIEWKNDGKQENVRVALMPQEQIDLAADGMTDDDIFFYFEDNEEFIANRLDLGGEDFKIVKVNCMF